MAVRPRKKDQRRLGQLQLALVTQLQRDLAGLQQVHMPAHLSAIEGGRAAKRAAVEGAGIDAEMREQGGQAIHG
ncbi:hypothetical protein D3C85_978960 [compost metagenome]